MAKKPKTTEPVDAAAVATIVEPETPEGYRKWGGAFMVPVDKLVFTDWNVNEMSDDEFSELVSEVESDQFDEPIGVIPIKDQPGHFLVPSGEHRTRAVIALGAKEIPAVLKKRLSDADEAEIKMWSVKRNHIRGRVNVEKFKALEKNLSEKHQIQREAARRRMLVKGELLKALQKDEPKPSTTSESSGGDEEDDGTQESKDAKQTTADRKRLLNALKNAEEEVLLKSGDTVQHGYLWFDQGRGTHLVVDATGNLHGRIKRMVAVCKNDSARIDEFLSTAIALELEKWEK